MKQYAFTLAEVLITLGIIGVVAAMTIPTLIVNYQKKVTLTRLKQSYAIVQNAILASQVENGDPQTWGLKNYKLDYDDDTLNQISKDIVVSVCEKYLVPYFKTATKSEYKIIKEAGWDEIHLLSGAASVRPSVGAKYYIINLANGAALLAAVNGSDANKIVSIIIHIDINGPQKPNVSGKDLFATNLSLTTGHFGFFGSEYTDLTNLCTDQGTGVNSSMGCGEMILRNGWTFPKDYPWK